MEDVDWEKVKPAKRKEQIMKDISNQIASIVKWTRKSQVSHDATRGKWSRPMRKAKKKERDE